MSAKKPALPWGCIKQEVISAVKEYMKARCDGQLKTFINVPNLSTFLYEGQFTDQFPHLSGISWDATEFRCAEVMRRLNWKRYSLHVFVIPYGPEGGISREGIAAEAEA